MDMGSLYEVLLSKDKEIERLRDWLRIIRDDKTEHEWEFATEALCGCEPTVPKKPVISEGFR